MVTGKSLVKCPECRNAFFTKKTEEAQCRECGVRFSVKENIIKV